MGYTLFGALSSGIFVTLFVTWIIDNWAVALVYYVLAGIATATLTSAYLTLRGQSVPHALLVVSVVLPPVWIAIVIAAIIRNVLLWAINKYQGCSVGW